MEVDIEVKGKVLFMVIDLLEVGLELGFFDVFVMFFVIIYLIFIFFFGDLF